MGGLEDGAVGADVGPGRQAEAADHPRPQVADDVAVEVGAAEQVVLLRPQHQLHAHVVDDAVLEVDVGVALGDLAADGQEEPVGVLHDVGLVHQRHLPAPVLAGVVEGELDDPLRT